MIKSWRHKGLHRFYLENDTSGIIVEHSRKLKILLQLLDAANSPTQLNLPGLGLHKLKGKLKDFYAITVRANWRVTFQFDGDDVILVDYLDYH